VSVTYRAAKKSDVSEMARIRAAEWGEEASWKERILGYLECEIHPRKARKARMVYVAMGGDTLVGFIAGHLTRRYECDGELQWINVAAERRGSGIAPELLRRLAAWFVGRKALKICVDVQPSNTVARRFYRRHGAEDLNPHWMVWNDVRIILQGKITT